MQTYIGDADQKRQEFSAPTLSKGGQSHSTDWISNC